MTLFVRGAGGGNGARAGWAGQRGEAGVVLTGIGEVEALRDGPWIEARGAGSRSGVPSSGPSTGARGWGGAGLEVEAEELIVLSG